MAHLILVFGIVGIVALISFDRKQRRFPSGALWFPAIWLAVLGSRSPAQWLNAFGLYQYSGSATQGESGNPIDSAYFLGMIIVFTIILARRQFAWGKFFARNKLLVLIYVYFLLSSTWAEYSIPTVKRVIKDFGMVLAALVLLTERNPFDAIRTVFVRISYILFPLSLIFIKYFPEIGRVPNRSGSNLFGGVATHKNTLGLTVFCLGLLVFIDLCALKGSEATRSQRWVRYGILGLGVQLLLICDSMTSLLCLTLGCTLYLASSLLARLKNPRLVLLQIFGVVALGLILESTFGISSMILALLGRDATLTGRTEIWDAVLQAPTNPLFGTGFYSFWSTEMGQLISEPFGGTLATVHNGFIETYVDGGLLALCILILLLVTWGWQRINSIVNQTMLARSGLVIWTLAMIYNNSETSFFRMEPLWFTLLLFMISAPAENWPLLISRNRPDPVPGTAPQERETI